MEISINPQSDLTRGKIESLLRLIDTPEKRRGILTDLCTLRENIEGLFNYETSPLASEKAHPLFKILITSNEIIGSLLISGADRFKIQSSKYGMIVEVVEEYPTAQASPEPPHLNRQPRHLHRIPDY